MENNCLLYPCLQKYYNALQNLAKLNMKDDLFVNISRIDSFFSEFRNITFVMQKSFSTVELKKYYESVRDEYLKKEDMKWFIDKRNEIIKENPLKLEKVLIVDIFSTEKNFTVIKNRFTIDNELSFSNLEKKLTAFLAQFSLSSRIYFSLSFSFSENGQDFDIYSKILNGLKNMNNFVNKIIQDNPCTCTKCKKIRKEIEELYSLSFVNNFSFDFDCVFYNNKIEYGSQLILLPGNYISVEDVLSKKINIDNTPIYKNCSNIMDIFNKFIISHITIYQIQKTILPTFFILYKNRTFSMLLFNSTIKTTCYRIISKIAEICKKEDVLRVLYAGEFNSYNIDDLKKKAISIEKRELITPKVILACCMIDKDNVNSVIIDSDKIDNNVYLKEQIEQKSNENFILFRPIQISLNK